MQIPKNLWKQLHEDLQHKEDLLLADDATNKTLCRVLDASFGKLGARQKTVFLKMAVIPKGAVAPEDMLLNLWEFEVSVRFLGAQTRVAKTCGVGLRRRSTSRVDAISTSMSALC